MEPTINWGSVLNTLSANSWAVALGAVAWTSLLSWYNDKKQYFRDAVMKAKADSDRKSVHKLDSLLHRAKSMSMRRVRAILRGMRKHDHCEQSAIGVDCSRSDSYWETLEKQMMLALDRSLFGSVRASIKYKIHNNGYHDLEGAELDEYCKTHATEAVEESRAVLADIMADTPLASIEDEDRFRMEEGIELFTQLIKSSKRYYNDAMKEIEKEKVGYKLPFIHKRLFG